MDVVIELFDTSGRELWRHAESGIPTSDTYTVTWNLSVDGGRPLGTGVYLYRVKVASEGSSYTSKTRKQQVIVSIGEYHIVRLDKDWAIRGHKFAYPGRKDTIKACIYVKELVRQWVSVLRE